MNFHVLTLFPEMVEGGLSTSITGRAVEKNKIGIKAVNIRDFSRDRHRKVDDYTYGGGAGMLMQAQPVYDAYKSIEEKLSQNAKRRVIYVTPQGSTFTQQMAKEFSALDDLIFLCGHYEGIDERVLEEIVTDYVSIGDYVLTGGELAAMVMIDAIARLVPGVLHNEMSSQTESFHGNLLEYPQYSRPEVWRGREVPQVLMTGNKRKIEEWRLEQSQKRTKERRPDLYGKYQKLEECKDILMKQKLLHIDMIELIRRGRAELVYCSDCEMILRDMVNGTVYHSCFGQEGISIENYRNFLADEKKIVLHQKQMASAMENAVHFRKVGVYYQAVYTKREKLPVSGLYRQDGKKTDSRGVVVRVLDSDDWKELLELYSNCISEDEIKNCQIAGAFMENHLVGAGGFHQEGQLDFLYVKEEYRNKKIGTALVTFLCNQALEQGWMPYTRIEEGNEKIRTMLQKKGFYFSKTCIVVIRVVK